MNELWMLYVPDQNKALTFGSKAEIEKVGGSFFKALTVSINTKNLMELKTMRESIKGMTNDR